MAINLFLWIVVGLVTGSMARKVMPGPAPGGRFAAILIGLIGAVVAGLVAITSTGNPGGQFNVFAFLMSANGSLYPLFLYRCSAMRLRSPLLLPRQSKELSPASLSAARLPRRTSDSAVP
jgi:uncharacterized membrane protein YeaQ/YmgE (transglycosylase-associated protein family)